MKKVILGLALFAVSWAANAIQVSLLSHNQTSGGGTISSLIFDGGHTTGIAGATTAIFDWDGTTLTSTGLYSVVGSIGSSDFSATILSDQITDLSIDTTGAGTASASAYSCKEGTFLSVVGASGCGGYTLGTNTTNDSTTIWGPGTAVSQTINSDDVSTGGFRTIAAFNIGTTVTFDGSTLTIGNGTTIGSQGVNGGGELLTFTTVPVPAAVWLFGSALGLLGWARRRVAQ